MRRRRVLAAGAATVLGLAGCGGADDGWPPPGPGTGPDWDALSSRLQGQLLRPGSPGFASAAPVFNTLYDSTVPAAVVRCASAHDVALALAFARRNRLPLAPRSGGHGYTGNSTTTGLVIDTGPLSAISVGAGTATIGAGARLVDVYDQLSRQGVCIPSGTCPTIGIAGITLGGGIGVVDRAYGLTCDRLVSADIVLADTSLVTCDATRHADLFWALRGGGGGNFGIVTSLTFETFPTRDLAHFAASFAWADAAAVFAAWQAWPQTLPDAAWAALVLGSSASTTGVPVVQVSGWFVGTTDDFAPLWNAFLVATGATPTSQVLEMQSFHDAMLASCNGRSVAECHPAGATVDGQVPRSAFVASSDFFDTALPPAGVQAMLDAVAAQQGQRTLIVILDLMGGAVARVAPEATAFVHRDALFSAQYFLPGVPAGHEADARAVATGLRAAMRPWSSGRAYQNYLDPDIADWPQAYYGANWARLLQVKAAVDPHRVFRPLQGVG